MDLKMFLKWSPAPVVSVPPLSTIQLQPISGACVWLSLSLLAWLRRPINWGPVSKCFRTAPRLPPVAASNTKPCLDGMQITASCITCYAICNHVIKSGRLRQKLLLCSIQHFQFTILCMKRTFFNSNSTEMYHPQSPNDIRSQSTIHRWKAITLNNADQGH